MHSIELQVLSWTVFPLAGAYPSNLRAKVGYTLDERGKTHVGGMSFGRAGNALGSHPGDEGQGRLGVSFETAAPPTWFWIAGAEDGYLTCQKCIVFLFFVHFIILFDNGVNQLKTFVSHWAMANFTTWLNWTGTCRVELKNDHFDGSLKLPE